MSYYSTTIYVDRLPQTRAEAQVLVNQQIVSNRRGILWGVPDSEGIDQISTWDGESYEDSYFCGSRCRDRQAYASAQHGQRYTWEKRA